MKKIMLTQGRFAIIDDEDYELINRHKWQFMKTGYAAMDSGKILMHRLIMGAGQDDEIDHINRNRLDNRRGNLRFCTHAQNMQNAIIKSDNTSGYKGVSFDKARKKWEAYININGNKKHIGRFTTSKEAAQAYDCEACKLFGEYARLNNA